MKAVHSVLVDVPNWQTEPEDDLICRKLGERLEKEHSIEFAKGMLAQHYSIEWDFQNEEVFQNGYMPFGFHGMAMLIATHKNDIPSLLDGLQPVTGWQLTTMAQFISALEQRDINAFYAFLQRHNLFDEFTRNLNITVRAVS